MKVIHCFKGLPTPIQHRTYSTGLYKLVYKRASCFKVQWKGEVNWSHINTPLAPVFISLSIPTYLYRSHLIEKPKYYKHCLNFPPFFLPYTKGIQLFTFALYLLKHNFKYLLASLIYLDYGYTFHYFHMHSVACISFQVCNSTHFYRTMNMHVPKFSCLLINNHTSIFLKCITDQIIIHIFVLRFKLAFVYYINFILPIQTKPSTWSTSGFLTRHYLHL